MEYNTHHQWPRIKFSYNEHTSVSRILHQHYADLVAPDTWTSWSDHRVQQECGMLYDKITPGGYYFFITDMKKFQQFRLRHGV